MKKNDDLTKKLTYEKRNYWSISTDKEREKVFNFAEGYKEFLSGCKTVRETVEFAEKALLENGFSALGTKTRGKKSKLYQIFKQKNVMAAVIGKSPISEGLNIVSPHIDTPRIDLKQNPLYQDSITGLGMLRTHYYGGIKKYQWMSLPLAIHGVVVTKDKRVINICIGEKEEDPIFLMPDILPHLAGEQYKQKIGDAVRADHMNVIFNSIPYPDEKLKEAVKLNALVMLNERYGITEEDFLSAELELVPAGKAKDCGLDRSFIAGYGHDDRVCSYTSLQAIINPDLAKSDRTSVIFFSDKEEIGSEGNTSAKSAQIIDFIAEILKANGENYDSYTIRKTLMNSQILSADVNAAINPNFPSVHEKDNAVIMGYGVSVTKFTGVRGKAGSNDANAEFTAKILRLFSEHNVHWQMGSLGKVDEGGGGTIAKFLAAYGAEVIDCGTGVVGMHSPCEMISKADLYSTYMAYRVFFRNA